MLSKELELPVTFPESKWFTRGWTLQELIAPSKIVFLDCDWIVLGTKQTLLRTLVAVTGIEETMLNGENPLHWFPVAQRMSWAASRTTKRKEDMACCLLGIFGVSMPVLYGEGGEKAFFHLQVEIMRSIYDHTLFAWPIQDDGRYGEPGLLAKGPAASAECRRIRTSYRHAASPYTWTNRDISITLTGCQRLPKVYEVSLDCSEWSSGKAVRAIHIYIKRLYQNDQYARVSIDRVSRLISADENALSNKAVTLQVKSGLACSLRIDPNMTLNNFGLMASDAVVHTRADITANISQTLSIDNKDSFSRQVCGFAILGSADPKNIHIPKLQRGIRSQHVTLLAHLQTQTVHLSSAATITIKLLSEPSNSDSTSISAQYVSWQR